MGSQGAFIALNNVVSQSVPHLHVHLVPGTARTGCAASSGRAGSTTARNTWLKTAAAIRGVLENGQ